YVRIDGEFKHWELEECCNQFWQDKNPPERDNIRFAIGLRNRIEHRDLPALDPSVYGECQALLLNFENLLSAEFGKKYALTETLALALQFSPGSSGQSARAIKALAAAEAKSLIQYIERFRSGLPPTTLAGPYGNRAGDILLLPKACMNVPIENRYYFAGMTHYSWHGSACEQDGHIPFIVAQVNGSGERMRSIMSKFGGASPSERELTPLVLSIFGK
ncbi:MAG: DUF3644 domain-containing protein, partial [Candidatus Binatus sp.]